MGRHSSSSSSSSSSRSRGRGGSPRRGGKRPRETGTINTWNGDKQFGFVSCHSKRADLFVHAEYFTDIDQRYDAKNKGFRRGDKISFEVQEPTGGKRSAEAVNCQLVEKNTDGSRSRSRNGSRSRSPSRKRALSPRTAPKKIDIRPGDWDCPNCGHHNFARNTECRRCSEAKPLGAGRLPVIGKGRSKASRSGKRSSSRKRRSTSKKRRSSSTKRNSSSKRRSRSKSRKRSPSGKKRSVSKSRKRSSSKKKRSRSRSARRKSGSRKRSSSKKRRSPSKERARSRKRSSSPKKKEQKEKTNKKKSRSSSSGS